MAERLAPFAGPDALAVASQLVATYGSPARALSASRESLATTLADHRDLANTIVDARELADFGSLDTLLGSPLDTADRRFLEYLQRMLGQLDSERLLGIFLDADLRFIAVEWLAFGQEAEVEVGFRAIVTRILELGARSVVLAHNHPSGDPRPSPVDGDHSLRLKHILRALDCELRDHLIVGARAIYSMARGGDL